MVIHPISAVQMYENNFPCCSRSRMIPMLSYNDMHRCLVTVTVVCIISYHANMIAYVFRSYIMPIVCSSCSQYYELIRACTSTGVRPECLWCSICYHNNNELLVRLQMVMVNSEHRLVQRQYQRLDEFQPVRLAGSFRCWFVKKYCWLVCVREKCCFGWKFTIVYDKP